MNAALLLLLLPCALALAQDGRRHHKPSASLSPPGEFNPSTQSTTIANPTSKQHSTSPIKPTTPKTTESPTHSPSTPAKTTKSPTHSPSTPAKTTKSPTHSTTPAKTTQGSHSTTHHTSAHPTMQPKTTPPSPKPTPDTTLEVGNYTIKNSSGALCVLSQMAVQIRKSSSNSTEMGTFIIQPNKTSTQGSCNDSKADLTLVFAEGNLTFLFQKNTTSNSVYVDFVSFNVNYPIISSGPTQHSAANSSVNLFGVAVGHSFSCSNVSVYMGQGYHLDVTHVQMQAFNLTEGKFGDRYICSEDQTNYHVAIAVGIVLLILIIIVVVAYFIGRRKRTDGYQSL